MGLFHQHKFKIIIKTHTPQHQFDWTTRISEYMAERLIFGVTTCVLRCKECGKIIKEELLGQENNV
mgnify:CR=1 FL=1